jgi:hypothetical protein
MAVRRVAHGREKCCSWPREAALMAERSGAHGLEKCCLWPREVVLMAERSGAYGWEKCCSWPRKAALSCNPSYWEARIGYSRLLALQGMNGPSSNGATV